MLEKLSGKNPNVQAQRGGIDHKKTLDTEAQIHSLEKYIVTD